MSPSGLASGLAFLPVWLSEPREWDGWDAALAGWVRANGWRAAGVVWPFAGPPALAQQARPDATDTLAVLPAELADVSGALSATQPTVLWQVPGTSGRLYTLLQPAGRPAGVVWAEKGSLEPWTDTERQYLALSARLMERSPALATKIGPLLDSDRLHQRLADSAVIAGRMAHDFNNILTSILGYADLSLPLVPASSQPAKYLTELGKVVKRGIQFTSQLHQFNHSGQYLPQPGQLLHCLTKEEARLRATAPPGVQLRVDIPTACALVAMDSGPLAAVVGHLLENAFDASPPHGMVRVTARPAELSAADARGYLGRAAAGPHVELTIQDEGSGLKPEVRARLFADPFFTTKAKHRGLGLAVVYRSLHAHAGGIRLDPVPPPGTGLAVRIVLPMATKPPATTPRPTVITKAPFGGG